MRRFHLQREAEADLLDIGRHTEERWGRDQRLKYLAALDRRFHLLAADPSLGKSCEEIYPGLRRARQGSHVIYFRYARGQTKIVRVLHEKMLPRLHLEEESD